MADAGWVVSLVCGLEAEMHEGRLQLLIAFYQLAPLVQRQLIGRLEVIFFDLIGHACLSHSNCATA